ncbi:MAG: hypothetical protein AB7O39_09880 [Flavobacteriaceae bacterium]
MKTSSAILAIAATLGLASMPAIANASLYHLNPAALVPASQSVMHAQGIAVADSSHEMEERREVRDDDHGRYEDDDDDSRGSNNAAPAGTVSPPANGLFNQQTKIHVN